MAAAVDAGIVTLGGAHVLDRQFHLQETADHDCQLINMVPWVFSHQSDTGQRIAVADPQSVFSINILVCLSLWM